jgi:hypothetical protein
MVTDEELVRSLPHRLQGLVMAVYVDKKMAIPRRWTVLWL